ncbi:MAG TPA: heavy metal-associated domain-containing protein [Candidatus Dojkabacteria bacterium]|nr:heavy metal-associated domain-containing protein [Candidatus Dojkabacteria bacterium]
MELKIIGMHCESCAELISMELEDLGLESFSIDFNSGLLTISDENINIEEIKRAIESAGDYTISI